MKYMEIAGFEPGPIRCERIALPAELYPQKKNGSKEARTPDLSRVRRTLIPAELCFHMEYYSTLSGKCKRISGRLVVNWLYINDSSETAGINMTLLDIKIYGICVINTYHRFSRTAFQFLLFEQILRNINRAVWNRVKLHLDIIR